jgi:hypothetical protein
VALPELPEEEVQGDHRRVGLAFTKCFFGIMIAVGRPGSASQASTISTPRAAAPLGRQTIPCRKGYAARDSRRFFLAAANGYDRRHKQYPVTHLTWGRVLNVQVRGF